MTEVELMISDCLNRVSKLSDWEHGFVSSIKDKTSNLNQMQLAKLEEIWERIT